MIYVVFGVAWGSIATLLTLIPAELFGLGSLGIIFGSVHFLGIAGGAIGPFLAGSIFDVTGSYRLALMICVMAGALAVVFSLILLRAKDWHEG